MRQNCLEKSPRKILPSGPGEEPTLPQTPGNQNTMLYVTTYQIDMRAITKTCKKCNKKLYTFTIFILFGS